MSKRAFEIIIPVLGVVFGGIVSVIKTPILGIGLLIAVLAGWEGVKRFTQKLGASKHP
ncbi:MAG: hypothetical protein OEW58_02280 [Gammaproteobacteria bacterium]|nr:hypothetical protein [Gammaproteobacteria bacterium]